MTDLQSQPSTAISDAVLAVSAFHASIRLSTVTLSGVGGFLFIGFAAICGVQRFAMSNPAQSTILRHNFLSWLARVLGLSCIAAAYLRFQNIPMIGNAHVAIALALILVRGQLSQSVLTMATEIVSSAAVVSTLLLSILVLNPYGIIGATVYVVSGLVIGTTGELYGILRVDLFHYALVFGNIALMMGLTQEPALVYYKPSLAN